MFVYCDDRKNIFYFKINDVITNANPGTKSFDDSFGISRYTEFYDPLDSISRPSVLSLVNSSCDSLQYDFLNSK